MSANKKRRSETNISPTQGAVQRKRSKTVGSASSIALASKVLLLKTVLLYLAGGKRMVQLTVTSIHL